MDVEEVLNGEHLQALHLYHLGLGHSDQSSAEDEWKLLRGSRSAPGSPALFRDTVAMQR